MTKEIKNKTVRIFESSIEKLSRILSNKWKIKVVFKHNTCHTDGRTIFLPVLPNNCPQELIDAIQGHLDHEAAHVVFTDFSEIKKIKDQPKLLAMVNALEDPRIERKWIGLWAGAELNIQRSFEWSLEKYLQEVETTNDSGQLVKVKPWDTLSDLGKLGMTMVVVMSCNFDYNHWFLQEIVEPNVLQKVKTFENILKKALVSETTKEVVDFARDILNQLNEKEVTSQQPLPSEEGETQPTQQEVELSSECEEVPNDPLSAFKKQPENTTKQQPLNFDVSDESVKNDLKILDKSNQIKGEILNSLPDGPDNYLIYTTETDIQQKIQAGSKTNYKEFVASISHCIAPIKRKLSRSLLSTNVSRWEGDKTRGKLNSRALYRVPTGIGKKVFKQKLTAPEFDTCVLMMIDHSGSMCGDPLDLAAKASITLGEVLNQLNIPFSVLGFSTGMGIDSMDRKNKVSAEEQNIYTRWGSLWIGKYKGFEEPWSVVSSRLINMYKNCKYNTYDGESLKYGAQLLLQRPEKRKIFFWLNDGAPCPNPADNTSSHYNYAKECAYQVDKMVELFAIGIKTDEVKNIYRNYVVIHDLQDLPRVCIAELDALMRKGKSLLI